MLKKKASFMNVKDLVDAKSKVSGEQDPGTGGNSGTGSNGNTVPDPSPSGNGDTDE